MRDRRESTAVIPHMVASREEGFTRHAPGTSGHKYAIGAGTGKVHARGVAVGGRRRIGANCLGAVA
jgi:hypothetical protein